MKKFISKIIRNKIFYVFWKKINNLSMYGMNYGVASGYADYSGELHIIKTIKRDLKNKKSVIFDIGAYIGDWSQFVINEYNDIDYSLYTFEPTQTIFRQLKVNLPSNNERISLHNIGFGNKKEKLEIFYNDAQGTASIVTKNAKFSEEIEIDTVDNFCTEHNIDKIDFLKMDVQGYEYNILLGAHYMLSGGKIKYIQFEFDEPHIENRIYFKDFWVLLSDKYDIYHSLYNGLIRIEEYHYTLENYRCMNYLAILK